MAARTRRTELSDAWRQKIRTSMLINRLQNHVLGRIQMTSTQIRAAEILFRKTLPDLTSVEHSGEVKLGLVELLRSIGRGDSESDVTALEEQSRPVCH